MKLLRAVLAGLATGAIVGAVPATFMCAAALDHNPQEEFMIYATGAYTGNLYRLFAAWMLVCGAPVAIVTAALLWFGARSD